MRRRGERGLTFVTVLMVLALLAGLYWALTFGGVYWDNHEIRSILRQAGNIAYQQHDDARVREWIIRAFDEQGFGGGKLEYDQNDLRLERVQSPPLMRIDFHYARTINLPVFGGQRRIPFDDHVEQDLSTVKW